MLKIAVLADLHLTDNPRSVKLQVLDWALAESKRHHADLLLGIGDLTATGTKIQSDRLFERIHACGLPFCATPGNAELRSGEDGAERQTIPPPDGFPLILPDSSRDSISDADLKKIGALPDNACRLLATHCPPDFLPEPQKNVIRAAQKRRSVTAIIAGHLHNDATEILRGMDPDKAAGGPPMISFFTQSPDGSWSREDVAMPGVDPAEWSPSERAAFRRIFGISCMYDPLTALTQAAELAIPVAELRYGTAEDTPDLLEKAIARWRDCGGRILSMHLPSLKPHTPAPDGPFARAIARTVELGCDRVTLHVPTIRASEYSTLKSSLLDTAALELEPLLKRGIRVGIENMHTINGDWAADHRTFGCTIEECTDWITALREKTGSDLVGFHLDIGHARNNTPFSQTQNVSDFYNVPELPINGFHFHQVQPMPDGTFENHMPLNGFYEKLIALSGYFLARRAGLLNAEAPVILEIRTPAGAGISCYRNLIRHF